MRYFILICVLLYSTTIVSSQPIIYVHQNASGANNGTNWTNAFTDLQNALSIAEVGNEIWVAEGIYKPTTTTNFLISFELVSGVKIYGGFTGSESTLEQRNWENNLTVLSGDLGVQGYAIDNSKHVVTGVGVDDTVLDGFKICNGAAFDPNGYGGAIYLTVSTERLVSHPIITNCKFEDNFAFRGGALAVDPYLTNSISGRIVPYLKNCSFKNNTAAYGGGAIRLGIRTIPGEVQVFENCQFENNSIGEPLGGELFPASAGAITLYSSGGYKAAAFFDHCSFIDNSATYYGGAIRFANESQIDTLSLHFRHCIFRNNTAVRGSVLYVESSNTSTTKQTIYEFVDCVFQKNNETDEEYPSMNLLLYNEGHLSDSKCSMLMDNCTISHNTCSECSQIELNAGAADLDVSIKNSTFFDNKSGVLSIANYTNQSDVNYFHFEMSNSIFANNEDCLGLSNGFLNGSEVKSHIINSTFVNNSKHVFVQSHTIPGVTLYPRYDTSFIENCIIWNPDLVPSNVFYNGLIFSGESENLYGYSIRHSLIALDTAAAFQLPGSEYAFGDGNIFNQWPQFIDTLNGNYRLEACSPAVNTGNNAAIAGLLFDADSLPRIAFGTVDMGAYEQQDSCIVNFVFALATSLPLLLSPNPSFDGQLHIEVPDIAGDSGVLRVTGITGAVLWNQKVSLSPVIYADLHHLPSGSYLVQLDTENGRFVGKWIKI